MMRRQKCQMPGRFLFCFGLWALLHSVALPLLTAHWPPQLCVLDKAGHTFAQKLERGGTEGRMGICTRYHQICGAMCNCRERARVCELLQHWRPDRSRVFLWMRLPRPTKYPGSLFSVEMRAILGNNVASREGSSSFLKIGKQLLFVDKILANVREKRGLYLQNGVLGTKH